MSNRIKYESDENIARPFQMETEGCHLTGAERLRIIVACRKSRDARRHLKRPRPSIRGVARELDFDARMVQKCRFSQKSFGEKSFAEKNRFFLLALMGFLNLAATTWNRRSSETYGADTHPCILADNHIRSGRTVCVWWRRM